jgi:hypothetical protein
MELELKGVATAFLERELGRLETELNSLHAQLPPLSSSEEIQLISVLKATLGNNFGSSNDDDNRSGWEMFDLVPPTLNAFARNSGWRNPLDRYTSGLLLQLKLRFQIQMKADISNALAPTAPERQENEDIDGTPTLAAPASSDETEEAPVHVDINDLMPSDAERQLQRRDYIMASHKEAKEETESKFKLVLEGRNVSTEKEADFLEKFRRRLQRIVEKLLSPTENGKAKKVQEGTRKRPHPNREEDEEEGRKNSPNNKIHPLAEERMDKNIEGEMDRLVREYERLMKQYLAAYVEFPSISAPTRSVPSPAQPVDPPTVSIAIHLGWNYTNVGWIPPNKSTAELLLPPMSSHSLSYRF